MRGVRRQRRHRWLGLPWAVGLTCVLTVWLVAPASAAGPRKPVAMAAEATDKTLTKCTFAALQKAVAAGGTAQFACSGTILFTQAITLSAGIGDPRRLGLVSGLRRPGQDAAVRCRKAAR